MKNHTLSFLKLFFSMLIFGSIGLFVRYISLESGIIAFGRAIIGAASLSVLLLLKHEKLSVTNIKKHILHLFMSGAAIGFNWILLFESYRYTSVAVSTLCYYMAPIFVVSLSPLVLKEKITIKQFFCILVAVFGIALISGVFRIENLEHKELTGVLFGLGAAVLYAAVILLNKRLTGVTAMERTVCQLSIAAVVLLPYNLLTSGFSLQSVMPNSLVLLVIVGIVHTGLAYYLYFGSMEHLSGQNIAIASYIDPAVAVIISAVFLKEPFTFETVIGAAAILGAALISDFSYRKGSKE